MKKQKTSSIRGGTVLGPIELVIEIYETNAPLVNQFSGIFFKKTPFCDRQTAHRSRIRPMQRHRSKDGQPAVIEDCANG